jgi:5-bromo-4-chloroindolyl phosphate hydrolysis protein
LKTSLGGRVFSILTGVVLFSVLKFVFFTSMSVALSIGFIGWLVVMLSSSKKQKDTTIIAEGTTKQDIEETIRNGRKLTLSMRQASLRLMQVEVKHEVEDLCRIAESMFDMLRKDPKDLRIVKQFITYYLEPTHKIVVKYCELATTRPMPADIIETLERTEKSLKSIRTTFLQQKEKMLANDVMDLDTEIKVFETVSGNMSTSSQSKNKERPSV